MPVYIEKNRNLVGCYHSRMINERTNDKQGKIELLSQWTMDGWDEQFPSVQLRPTATHLPHTSKNSTKTSWFSLLVAPIFFSDFRWLCVWWSTGFLSAFMAHKGSGASIGIECLLYWGGRNVPMQGVSVLFRFWFVHLSDSDSLRVSFLVGRWMSQGHQNYWVSAIKKMANKTLKF